MQTEFTNSFVKDLRKLSDNNLMAKIRTTILEVESAESLADIANLKYLVKSRNHYRIRIGDYRIGLKFDDGVITLIRCLHRRDIYKRFP